MKITNEQLAIINSLTCVNSVKSLLESVRAKKGIKKEDVAKILHTSVDSTDINSLFDRNVKNVGKTFPGIEIVHFCANDDCDPDEHLVNYYSQKLKFSKADEHSAAMPIYDFTCKFMYQKISNLSKGRDRFYDNFNHDEDAV